MLASEDGRTYVRAWQAKRYTSSIKWGECEESLDSAVKNYRVPHVTYCFARNLTGPQEKKFNTRLASRHKGVRVDWIGADVLHAALTATPQGVTVAKYFFGASVDDKEALERAIALGGRVDTVDDVLEHLGKVHGALKDPYFKLRTATYEPDDEDHIAAANTVMSLITQDSETTSHIDISPRDEEAMRLFAPEFTMDFTDDEAGRRAREVVDAALARNQAVEVEGGVRITFDRYPEFLEQVLGEPMVPDVVRMTPGEPVVVPQTPWTAELAVDGNPDVRPVLVDLEPEDPPPDWDATVGGAFGGTRVRMGSRWRDGRGELNFNLRHVRDSSPAADQAAALRLLRALATGGRLTVADQSGNRPTMTLGPGGTTEFGDHSRQLLAFLEDVAFVEQWAGVVLPLPEAVTAEDYQRVREFARMARSGQVAVNFSRFELEVNANGLAQAQAGGRLVAAYPEMQSDVLGVAVPVRAFVSLEPYVVAKTEPVEGREGYSTMVIEPPPDHDGGYVLKVEPAVVPDSAMDE